MFHNGILVGIITGHYNKHGIAARVIKARIEKRIGPVPKVISSDAESDI